MAQALQPKRPGLLETIVRYEAREPKFFGTEREQRRADFEMGYGINRLEGAGQMLALDSRLAELRISGRITDDEYFKLCEIGLQDISLGQETPHPGG